MFGASWDVLTRVWKLLSKMPHQKIISNIILHYNTPKMCIIHRPKCVWGSPLNMNQAILNRTWKNKNAAILEQALPPPPQAVFKNFSFQPVISGGYPQDINGLFWDLKRAVHFQKQNVLHSVYISKKTECPPYDKGSAIPETECPPYCYISKNGMPSLQQYKGIPYFKMHCSHILLYNITSKYTRKNLTLLYDLTISFPWL